MTIAWKTGDRCFIKLQSEDNLVCRGPVAEISDTSLSLMVAEAELAALKRMRTILTRTEGPDEETKERKDTDEYHREEEEEACDMDLDLTRGK